MAFVEKIGDFNPYASSLAKDLPLNFVDTLHWDYDGDGDSDRLVVAANGTIQYFRNDGSGNYTQLTHKANPFTAINVGVGGKISLDAGNLVVSAANGKVRYFEQLEQQKARTTVVHTSAVGSEWRLVGSGDFDGDGDDDVLWQHKDGLVHYWEMQNGVWVTGRDAYAEEIHSDWHLIGSGDFDGDGDDDILWQHKDGLVHYWEMQNGVRVTGRNAYAEEIHSDWHIKGAGDFDGDGDDDILWQHKDGLVHYWEMENGARVTGHNPYADHKISSDWAIKGTGDFDGDGDDDILWQNGRRVHYWEIQNGARVNGHDPKVDTLVGSDWTLKGAGDFNNDGKASLLWQKGNGQVVTTTASTSQVTAATPKVVIETYSRGIGLNKSVTNVIVGDFDGDGKDDFIRQEKGAWDNDLVGTAQVLLSRGDSTFSTYHGVELGANLKGDLTNIIVGDFNGDGKDDFIRQEKGWYAQDVAEATATLYLANGNGNSIFSATSVHKGGGFNGDLTNIIVGDFNGDGKDDFIRQEKGWYAQDISDATATLYLANSNGNGTFSVSNIHNGGSFNGDLTNIIVGDFNGDGKDDFIRQEKGWYVNDISDAPATLYLANSNGNGTFSVASIPKAASLSGDLTNIIVGDFNGDGRDDFIRQEKGWYVNDPVESTGSVYLANANGGFSIVNLPNIMSGDFTNLIVGDYNGDGKDDFIRQEKGWYVDDVSDAPTILFTSKGDGTFTHQNLQDMNGNVTELVVGDLNGDGYDDILGNGQQGKNNLLVGISGRKVNALENFVQSSGSSLNAETILATAIASSMSAASRQFTANNGNVGQVVSKQLLGLSSIIAGELARTAIRSSSRAALSSASWALMIGAELTSVILAETGNTELAGYFGSGANPVLDVGKVGDSLGVSVGEIVHRAISRNFIDQNDALGAKITEVAIQTLVNIATSPIDLFVTLFDAFTGGTVDESVSLTKGGAPTFAHVSSSVNYYDSRDARTLNYYNPRSAILGGNSDYISVVGSNHNDILKGRLLVQGGRGDDTLVGRLNTSEDAYFKQVSQRIANGDHTIGIDHALNNKYHFEIKKKLRSRPRNFSRLTASYYPDPSNSKLDGGDGNDKLFSKVTSILDGGAGNDQIKTTYYSRTIQGGTGDDVISVEVNDNSVQAETVFNLQSIDGGAGHDHLLVRSPYGSTTILSDKTLYFAGTDVQSATVSGIEQATLIGNNQNDIMSAWGFSGTALLNGGAGDDSLIGSNSHASSLLGGTGNDDLAGGNQGDVLVGGAGYDRLSGAKGADVFLLNSADAAHDTITDFNKAQGDIIVIDTTAFGKLYESDLANFRLGSSNGSSELYYGNNKLATINGSQLSDLQLGQNIIFTEYYVTAQV